MQKNIFITGCSSGIGLAAAQDLKQRGYRVITSCRKKSDVEKLQQQGFESILLDLDDTKSVEAATEQVINLTGNRLYALFNNAGFGLYGPLNNISRQQLEQQFSTNFFGIHQLTQLLLPAMLPYGEGRIIQTSSIVGFLTTPGRGAYCASKHALEAWSDALRLELNHTGIQVSIIQPGPIKTNFSQNVNQTLTDKPVTNPAIASRFTLTTAAILPKLHHALEHRHAKIRYRVTLVTQIAAILKRLLPDYLMDLLLRTK